MSIPFHPCKAQRHTGRVLWALLDLVHGDFGNQLGAHVHDPLAACDLELEQPLCLPLEQLVGQPFEGLAEHDDATVSRVPGPQMEVGEPAAAPPAAPLGRQHNQVQGMRLLDL